MRRETWTARRAWTARRGTVIRWLSRAVTFVAIVALVGCLPFLSGKDPATSVLRARSAEQLLTDEALQAVRKDLGLGDTALETLWLWLTRVAQGDLGNSWVSGAPVAPSVASALGVSLSLMVAALAVAAVVAVLLCVGPVRSGLRGTPRAGTGMASAALTAFPEFLLASLLLVVVSVWLGWLPPFGWEGPENIVLPALSLGIPAGGLLGRLAAESLTSAFREPWVFTCQMAGFSRPRIVTSALRRAFPALLPQVGLVMVGLTGGAVAVEEIFTVPGIGRTALGAAASSDLPMLQASVMVLLLLGVSAGGIAHVAGRLLLGSALDSNSLVSDVRAVKVSRWWWVAPSVCALILIALVAVGAGLDPQSMQFPRLAAPGARAGDAVSLVGADASGRDVMARVAHGAMSTIGLALMCALVSWVIGLAMGLVPGVALGPLEAANAVPPVLAGILVATILGPSDWGATLAVLLVSWAPLAAHTASLRDEVSATPYATMAPLLGVSRARFLVRTVLPTIAGPVFRHAMLRVPGIALAIASLGFLGLGPQPPRPDWGLMLADGITYIERAPWVSFAPMAALVLLSVLAVSASSRKV